MLINRHALVNYGRRRHEGLPILTAFVESAVNEILSKRMIKKQQMRWNRWTVQPFLDVRIAVLNKTLAGSFTRQYPDFQTDNDNHAAHSQRDEPHNIACSLLDGQSATNPLLGDPQTALWFMLYTQVLQTDGASWRNVLLGRQLATLLTAPQQFGRHTAPAANREPRGTATFLQDNIASSLGQLGLATTSPLSVLAGEILPGPIHPRQDLIGAASTVAAATTAPAEDPLGSQLGQRRILRTSPLAEVPAIC